jgi:hypothetical protein
MDQVVPWAELMAVIEPFWPKGERRRPPFPLETMLRIHLMQQWYALSDPTMEKVRYRRLAKNTGQLQVLVALANLYLARRHLVAATG